MVIFALVVLISSICIFFKEEITGFIKSIFNKPDENILVPLVVFSILVITYEIYIIKSLSVLKNLLMQYSFGTILSPLCIIYGSSSLLTLASYALIKYRKLGDAETIAARIYYVVWIILAMACS